MKGLGVSLARYNAISPVESPHRPGPGASRSGYGSPRPLTILCGWALETRICGDGAFVHDRTDYKETSAVMRSMQA